ETNRIENARAHELENRDPRRLFDGHTGEGVVGGAVLPARARLEVERLPGPRVGDGLRCRRLEHPRHHVILRPEVLVAGVVAEEHADSYVISAGEPGNVFRNRIVELELAFLLENERGDG